MTEISKEQVEALIAAFEPEAEMEYVLPEWETLCAGRGWIQGGASGARALSLGPKDEFITERNYNALRELTKRKKGREWDAWVTPHGQLKLMSDPAPGTVKQIVVREVAND